MTTTTRREADRDRDDVVNYDRAAMQLRSFARHYQALMGEVTVDPALASFGPTIAVHLRCVYDDLAAYLTTAADQAQAFADQARERLGVPA